MEDYKKLYNVHPFTEEGMKYAEDFISRIPDQYAEVIRKAWPFDEKVDVLLRKKDLRKAVLDALYHHFKNRESDDLESNEEDYEPDETWRFDNYKELPYCLELLIKVCLSNREFRENKSKDTNLGYKVKWYENSRLNVINSDFPIREEE